MIQNDLSIMELFHKSYTEIHTNLEKTKDFDIKLEDIDKVVTKLQVKQSRKVK